MVGNCRLKYSPGSLLFYQSVEVIIFRGIVQNKSIVKGGEKMRKLNKTKYRMEQSLESYSCSCTCTMSCSCSCDCTPSHTFWYNSDELVRGNTFSNQSSVSSNVSLSRDALVVSPMYDCAL